MLRSALFLIACVSCALAAAQQGLVLQDESSALYIDDQLRIVNLIHTQLPLSSFLAPLHDWWSAEFVANSINGASPAPYDPLSVLNSVPPVIIIT
jgi:hypothetical protein